MDLETLVKSEVDALGYELVLVRRGGTRSRPVVEVRIDRRDGLGVSVADCARVSRAIEARLDAADGGDVPFAGGRYELQVSSPGEERRRGPDGVTPRQESDGGHRTAGSAHTDEGSRHGRID